MTFNQVFISVIVLLSASIAGLFALLTISLRRRRGRVERALNMQLFLITLPQKKYEADEKKSEKEIISVMEQLYGSLHNIRETKDTFFYGQPHLAFEIAASQTGGDIAFYAALPRRYKTIVEKQIHGLYPGASVEAVEGYNIFSPKGKTAGSYLKLKKKYILPFKTYKQLEADPLGEITNTFSKIAEKGEGMALQMLIRPNMSDWQGLGNAVAQEMQQGKSFSEALSAKGGGVFWRFLREMFSSVKTPSDKDKEIEKPKPAVTPGREEIIKALEEKAGKVGFDANLRLLVSAADRQRAEELLKHLESAFVQFDAPNLNQLRIVKVTGARALKRLAYHFSFRLFNPKERLILNTEELTSIFHFPGVRTETPKVKFLKAETAPAPANIPKEGIILGKNVYRGVETVIRMKEDDRRRHFYIVGQTGTGKSTLMKNMALQDIKAGHGVGVMEPHGELIGDLLGLIPEERMDDVVLIDPTDMVKPVSLNMLEYDPKYPEQKTFVVNELISIFDKLYDLKQTGGPMFEQYTRNALLLLMDDPSETFTIVEIPKVLSDRDFRNRLLAKCKSIIVKDFWEKEAEKAGGEAALQNLVPYVTSKFNVFIANDYMRPIIGQAKSSLNFRQIMDERKILLVNLSKGRLGDINSHLLGLIVTGKILMAALSRVDIPFEERYDFHFYMDEFQNFTTESIGTILSEARKYRLCLNIAHQFIGQLPDNIKGAVFGNVGSRAVYRVGAEDAEFLVKQLEPVCSVSDLVNVANFNCYAKLMIDNQTSRAFSLAAYHPEKGSPEVAEKAKEISRDKYGRDKAAVDEEISRRWSRSAGSGGTEESVEPDSDIQ